MLRILIALVTLLAPAILRAAPRVQLEGFREAQAHGASQAILLGVQQGIATLPPTNSQALIYEFDYESEAFASTFVLGPTAFRSAKVIGQGSFSLRVATSFFRLKDELHPIDYEFRPDAGDSCREACAQSDFSRFGMSFRADVGVVNLGATYGVTRWLEARLTVPIVLVDAKGAALFPVFAADENKPPGQAFPVFRKSLESLDEIERQGGLATRGESFSNLGFNFDDGGNVGLGRVGLGAKAALLHYGRLDGALETELFLPSPNEDEYAGPESVAFLPRAIGGLELTDWLRLHLETGYQYDTSEAPLRRFVMAGGASAFTSRLAVDAGVGWSEFEDGVKWTPSRAPAVDLERQNAGLDGGGMLFQRSGNNELDHRFVDALIGLKVRLVDQLLLSGTLSVPVVGTDFRPDVIWTLGVEYSH